MPISRPCLLTPANPNYQKLSSSEKTQCNLNVFHSKHKRSIFSSLPKKSTLSSKGGKNKRRRKTRRATVQYKS